MKCATLQSSVIIFFAVITMGFQCEMEELNYRISYLFEEKITLSPYKKSYSIGDTITIEYHAPNKKLYDTYSRTFITTDTSKFMLNLFFQKRFPASTGTEPPFDAMVENPIELALNNLSPERVVLSFQTDCSAPTYQFKASFVLKQTGVYSLDPYIYHKYCVHKIDKPNTTTRFTFDLADCNKDIWLTIPEAVRGQKSWQTELEIDRKQLFVFKVE